MSASLFNDKPLLMVNRKLIGTAGFISPRIGYGHYTPWKQKNWSGRHRPNIAYKLLIFIHKLFNASGGTVKGTVKKLC